MPTHSGRDNGLPGAAAYDALVDVDPPVADRVLMLLYGAGIAAYAEPLVGERGPYQNVQPPARLTERLYVDRSQRGAAEEVVGAELPTLRAEFHAAAALSADREHMEKRQSDLDGAAWDALVAGFHAPADPERSTPWPGAEDLTEPPTPSPGTGSGLSRRLIRRATPTPESTDAADVTRADDDELDDLIRAASFRPEPGSPGDVRSGHGDGPDAFDDFDADEDDHFQPPNPPPLPETDPVTRFAWAGVIGGPAVLVINAILSWPLGTWVGGLSMIAFVGGFVTLIARMNDRNPDDEGWDDGAVL